MRSPDAAFAGLETERDLDIHAATVDRNLPVRTVELLHLLFGPLLQCWPLAGAVVFHSKSRRAVN